MSLEQSQRTLNTLDKEIADLEKLLADESKKEADKNKRISDINRSINKHTSVSSLQSKSRQIQGYQRDLVRIQQKKAEIIKKLGDKRKKRNEAAIKLQKETEIDRKNNERAQERILNAYSQRISELTTQLNSARPSPPINVNDSTDNEEYDVFISHASEDKESFVDALCSELQSRNIKVWYDALNMTWGDSLRAEIDKGLCKAKYGIVVISKDYIKKGWTNYELDGLVQREVSEGKVILPIWHNITKQEVQDFSPTLANKLAMNSAIQTPAEIAEELKKILGL